MVAIAAEVAGATPEVAQTHRLRAGHRPGTMPAVVRRLDAAEITVAELALRGSSLDEVFLSLTGRRAEQDAAADADDLERIPA